MENGAAVVEKARQTSASLYPHHKALVEAIRVYRGLTTGVVPKVSDVVQDAIVALARRELDPAVFARIAGEAEDDVTEDAA